MTSPGAPLGRLVAGVSLEEPERLAVAGGEAVLFTAAAPGHETNEDAVGLFPLRERGVLAVADGVGGHPAGESASRKVLECLWDALLAADTAAESLRGPILDGIEAGTEEIFPDPFAVQFGEQYARSPKESERQVAAMVASSDAGVR